MICRARSTGSTGCGFELVGEFTNLVEGKAILVLFNYRLRNGRYRYRYRDTCIELYGIESPGSLYTLSVRTLPSFVEGKGRAPAGPPFLAAAEEGIDSFLRD